MVPLLQTHQHLFSKTLRVLTPQHSHPYFFFRPINTIFVTANVKSDPHDLLDEIPERDFRSCNESIRSYTANSQYSNAVATFKWMHNAKLRPDPFAFAAVIKASSAFSGPTLGESLHGIAIKGGFASSSAIEKAIMNIYSRFGSMGDSCRVFKNMCRRDSVSWNVLLSGYARAGLSTEAMHLFYSMHTCDDPDIEPNSVTIAVVLAVCAKLRLLKLGMSLHGYSIKRGLDSETLVGNTLVSIYSKCGDVVNDAVAAFRAIGFRDVVSWNSMMAGYSENGHFDKAVDLFYEMVFMGFRPNYTTVMSVLPVCALVKNGWWYGKEIHCCVLRFALDLHTSVCNALLIHYLKVGDMEGAKSVFEKMSLRDIVTWNTIISGYAMNGYLTRAIDLFRELTSSGIEPDSVTLITLLPVCAELVALKEGRKIHDYILQRPKLLQDTSIGNALISFYGKCGEVDSAMEIFMGIPEKDLISWNAMLNAFSDNGQWEKLFDLFNQMTHEGIRPDSITITSVLQACSFSDKGKIREAHGFSFRAGFTTQAKLGNSILDAYAKCGDIESACKTFGSMVEKNVITGNTMISGYLMYGCRDDAEKIFNQMFEKDITTWNLMLQVYTHNDFPDLAINLFRELQEEGMRPDNVSIMRILAASGRLASVSQVKQCHGYTIRASFDDLHLNGALLDTYSKCGSIKHASKLFQIVTKKDLVTFTAMVSGYAMHGMAKEAVGIFNQMLQFDVKPDHVIFTSLLSACSHAGLADEGWKHFKAIREVYGMRPTMEHYACMVDLLARRGRLKEAYNLLKEMPFMANANVWGSLLGSCKTYGEVEIGQLAADNLLGVEDVNIGNYVVMSNIYAADGMWDGVEKVRKLMKGKDLRKPAGCSWIEVEKMRHVFVAGDLSHPKRSFIYNLLGSLDQQLKGTSSEALMIEVS